VVTLLAVILRRSEREPIDIDFERGTGASGWTVQDGLCKPYRGRLTNLKTAKALGLKFRNRSWCAPTR
jgi:hypothetical protein